MFKRKIVEINRDLCDGCGLCTTACAEGALALDDDNKAILVREIYCDGMGACLDVCPTGALRIIDRESEGYDSQAAYRHVLKTTGQDAANRVSGIEGQIGEGRVRAGHKKSQSVPVKCPGSAAFEMQDRASPERQKEPVSVTSELKQWPIQLQLVSPHASYFQGSDLLIAADCTAFALGSFHHDLLKDKKLIIACPKLDETKGYVEKLSEIIKRNNPKSLSVAIMTVPCCSALFRLVELGAGNSGLAVKVSQHIIGIDGQMIT